MTNDHDGRGSWWEFDPEEKPVPLSQEAHAVAAEAESIVESEREAIIREDTEPTLQTLAAIRRSAPSVEATSVTGSIEGILERSVMVPALALLLTGCLVMFGLGWREGAIASDVTRPRTVPVQNSSFSR